MSDKKIHHSNPSGFTPRTDADRMFSRENTSAYLGMSVVKFNSMWRLAQTPLSLQASNLPRIPLQSRANRLTQKSQLAAENASANQRQQASSGAQAASARGETELDELDEDGGSGHKKSEQADGSSSGGMSAAKKPTQFGVKAVEQTTVQGSMFRTVANLREQQQELEQAFARSKLPGVELLTKAPGPDVTRASMLPLLAQGLMTAVNLPHKAGVLPSSVAAQLMLVRAFITAVPPHENSQVSMENIKQCLVEAKGKATLPVPNPGVPDEQRENSLVLAPLMILHACRKRTLQEQPLTANRIGLILSSRALG